MTHINQQCHNKFSKYPPSTTRTLDLHESATEGHPGTDVSAYNERFTIRRKLQVDREFQKLSASLGKRRLRTF